MDKTKTGDVIKKRMNHLIPEQKGSVAKMIGFIHNKLIEMDDDDVNPSEWVIVQALCHYMYDQQDTTEADVVKDWFDENDLTFRWDEGAEQYVLIPIKAEDKDEPNDIEIAWESGQEAANDKVSITENPYSVKENWYPVLASLWAAGYMEYQNTQVYTSIKLTDNS